MALLKDFLLFCAIGGLLWIPLGTAALRLIGGGALPAGGAVAFALGMGAWGLAVLLLGSVGALQPAVVGAAVLFCSVLVFRGPRTAADAKTRASSVRGEMMIVLLLTGISTAYAVLVAASAFAPETAFDALNVYLPYARVSAAARRIAFAPNNWNSSMPMLPVMSYATAFLFSGQHLAKLINAGCWLACGGVVYAFAARRWSRLHGAAAATLVWSSPVALYEATTSLIDLPFALFSAVALMALLEWTAGAAPAWLRLSAAALGLALGCKYHALFLAPPILAVLAWEIVAVRKRPWGELARAAAWYGVIAGALWLPWLIRAWVYTGNPVFPLANSVFKSPYWTPAMDSAARAAYLLEGVGTGWRELLKLPWLVTFDAGPFRGTLGVVFLPALVAALAFRRRIPEVRYLALVTAIFFYEWALTAQEIRYLLPLLPALAWVASIVLFGEKPVSVWRSWAAATVVAACALSSWPTVYPRWTREWTYWHSYQSPWPLLLGRQSEEEFLRRDVPSFAVYDWINAHLTDHNRVLLLNDASQFYSRVPTLYSYTVEGEEILLQPTVELLLERLSGSRIDHVLLNYNGIAPLPGVDPRPGVAAFLDPGFRARWLEEIHARNNVVLYRVRR
jgi:hypothetical protein